MVARAAQMKASEASYDEHQTHPAPTPPNEAVILVPCHCVMSPAGN